MIIFKVKDLADHKLKKLLMFSNYQQLSENIFKPAGEHTLLSSDWQLAIGCTLPE